MEEHHSSREFAEPSHVIQNEPTATTQTSQSTLLSLSERSSIIYPSIDSPLLLRVPTSQNSAGERARGEPAAPAICQHIVGLLGQITEHQDDIMRELRMMRRDMRLMKGEQRRTHAQVISLVHGTEALKEQFEQQ